MIPKFIRLPEVIEISGLSKTTIYELVAAGAFPSPVKIGPRASAWLLSELEAWAASRVLTSRAGGA